MSSNTINKVTSRAGTLKKYLSTSFQHVEVGSSLFFRAQRYSRHNIFQIGY